MSVAWMPALELGAVTQTVEVTGAPPMLQTDRTDVRHDLTAETIKNVPMPPGNNFESLLATVPGVNPPTTAHSIPTNPSRALAFNVNGTSEYGNDVRIDGVSQFNIWVPENAAYIPSSDAIQVVNVVTGNFNPEQGLAGGSTVNVQVKSGSNQFHGDVYEYHFNNALEAHNFFDPNNKITRVPKDIFNQFGGSVGGPIKHNKVFFFSNVEATRQRQFATQVATIPTLNMMQGDLRGSDPENGLAANPYVIYDPTTGNAEWLRPRSVSQQHHSLQPDQSGVPETPEPAATGAGTVPAQRQYAARRAVTISPPLLSPSTAPPPTRRSIGTPATSSPCSATWDSCATTISTRRCSAKWAVLRSVTMAATRVRATATLPRFR